MKHIGIVVPAFHVPSETFVVTEINALVRAGHKVSVITFENSDESSNIDKSVNVIVVKRSLPEAVKFASAHPGKFINTALIATKFKSISTQSLLGFGANIAAIIKQHKISHIHCHFMHAPLAYAIAGSKMAGISVSHVSRPALGILRLLSQ